MAPGGDRAIAMTSLRALGRQFVSGGSGAGAPGFFGQQRSFPELDSGAVGT